METHRQAEKPFSTLGADCPGTGRSTQDTVFSCPHRALQTSPASCRVSPPLPPPAPHPPALQTQRVGSQDPHPGLLPRPGLPLHGRQLESRPEPPSSPVLFASNVLASSTAVSCSSPVRHGAINRPLIITFNQAPTTFPVFDKYLCSA